MSYSYYFNNLIPYKYQELPFDFDAVTVDVEYQDGGKNFAENAVTFPLRWTFEYKGLSRAEAAAIDTVYRTFRLAYLFPFTDKNGATYTDCRFEKFDANHDGNKSWTQSRSFTIVKFNASLPVGTPPPPPPAGPPPEFEGTKTFAIAGYQGVAAEGSNLHVIAGDYTVAPIYYYRSPDEGATWDINGTPIATGIPYLEKPLRMSGNNIALFYFKNTVTVTDFFGARLVGELYCIVSGNNGATWGTEKLVSGAVVAGQGLRMSARWNGTSLHVTWMDFKNATGTTRSWDLYYNRSLDAGATWETEQLVVTSTNQTGVVRPSISSIGNAIHLAWFAGIDGKGSCTIDSGTVLPECTEVFHMRNLNNGAAGDWQTKNQLTNNTDPILYSGRTEIIAIAPSTVLVSFDRSQSPTTPENDIYRIRSLDNGATWTEAEAGIVVGTGVQTHPQTAEGAGKTHLVWGDDADGNSYYKQSSDNGFSFGATQLAMTVVGAPLIAVSTNYVHVVGNGKYRRRLVSAAGDTTSPSVPAMTARTGITASTITWNWNAATDNIGVSGYTLQIATDSGFTTGLQQFTLGNVVSKQTTGLNPLTTYYARVLAKDAAGNQSAYSSSVNTATLAGASYLTGIVSRFKASSLTPVADGTTVSSWSASVGSLLYQTNTNGTIALPTYKANVIGTKAAVRFDATDTQGLKLSANLAVTTAASYAIVAVPRNGPVLGSRVLNSDSVTWLMAFNRDDFIAFYTPSTTIATYAALPTQDVLNILVGTTGAAGSKAYLNATDITTANTNSTVIADPYLGRRGGPATASCDIFEIVFWDRVLTAAEVTEFQTDMAALYS